jgi:hypothetical protein
MISQEKLTELVRETPSYAWLVGAMSTYLSDKDAEDIIMTISKFHKE